MGLGSFKLMLCSDFVRDYIKKNNLGQEDYVFNFDHGSMNRYFKRLAKRVLGDAVSPAGQKYSELTVYDFRNNGHMKQTFLMCLIF